MAVALDAYGQRSDPQGTYDAIVVAGCRVLPDGSPSLSLVRRTTKAVELWRRGAAPLIALTGGSRDALPAESMVAAEVARKLGVPESALVLEIHSTSTAENARCLRALVTFNRIVVVTDSFHVFRCEWFFGKYFQEVRGVGVLSPLSHRTRGAFREAVAIAYYVVLRQGA
jgi:uncharacterized SAM-binding protein YcdF (DUF218 family)